MTALDDSQLVKEVTTSFTELAKDYHVLSFSLKDREVTSISFSHGSIEYIATFEINFIKLFERDKQTLTPKELIAQHNIWTGNTLWYLNHQCETPGFGDGENVRCLACNLSDSPIQDRMWNRGILYANGKNYSRELSDVLKNGIMAYVSNFNEFCKK